MKKKKRKAQPIQPRKIKFLTVKKNTREKFEDIISKYKHPSHTENKHGETVFSKRKFNKLIKDHLKLSPKQLERFFAGDYKPGEKKKLDKLFKAGKYVSEKKETIKFTKHTFTWDNFPKKKISNLGKHEQYYFRCGLKIVAKSKGTKVFDSFDGEMFEVWTIPNLPVSLHEPNIRVGFPNAYKKFFQMIRTEIHKMPSIWFFSFNYFDVTILKM